MSFFFGLAAVSAGFLAEEVTAARRAWWRALIINKESSMKEKQPTYEATKLKKILGSLDRGELTHGLAVFKDFKNMNREIALCTDKLFGEILETDVQSNEEAKLFLRRLQDSQNKMAIELKQHRLDPKSNEGQLLKKVADKIQFWKFEGEQLWKIAGRAARKTVAIIRSITDDWRTMAVPFEAD